MPILDDPYADWVLPHASSPRFRGEPGANTVVSTTRNPTCGDEVQLAVTIDSTGNVIQSALCQPRGCLIIQAAASILREHLAGRFGSRLLVL